MSSKPMLIVILDHDAEHERFTPGTEPYRMQWLAFRERDRKVLAEVEAETPAGIAQFRERYRIGKAGAQAEERPDHALPGDPAEWRSLVGEREAGDDSSDPMKHVKRRDRLAGRFEAERKGREERERDRRDRESLPAAPPAPPAPARPAAPESASVPDPSNDSAAVVSDPRGNGKGNNGK